MAPGCRCLGLYIGKDYLNFSPGEQSWVFNAFAHRVVDGDVLRRSARRSIFRPGEVPGVQPLDRRSRHAGPGVSTTFWPFFGLMLLHCFFFVPTMSVTNAIVFANIKDAQKDFGSIRLWGTIGWIAASWPFIFIPIDWAKVPSMGEAGGFVSWLGTALSKESLKTGPAMASALASTFTVAGIASLVLAAFCLVLPHTPPAKGQGESFAPFEAFKILRVPSILILFIVTFIDSLVHYTYFFWSSKFLPDIGLAENWIAPAMSIGQIAEIATMAFLGLVLKKLGWRTTMILGILGHVVRFGIYSIGTQRFALAGHREQRRPWLLLCLLLRHRLHLRG